MVFRTRYACSHFVAERENLCTAEEIEKAVSKGRKKVQERYEYHSLQWEKLYKDEALAMLIRNIKEIERIVKSVPGLYERYSKYYDAKANKEKGRLDKEMIREKQQERLGIRRSLESLLQEPTTQKGWRKQRKDILW